MSNMETNAHKKQGPDGLTRSTEAGIVFTSITRNVPFQYEREPASFFGWKSCAYRTRQFSYRRSFDVGLNRRGLKRLARKPQFAF